MEFLLPLLYRRWRHKVGTCTPRGIYLFLLILSFLIFSIGTFNEPGDISAAYSAHICHANLGLSVSPLEPPQMPFTIRPGAFPAGAVHDIIHVAHLPPSSHLFS